MTEGRYIRKKQGKMEEWKHGEKRQDEERERKERNAVGEAERN